MSIFDELQLEFTRDPELVQQYCELRCRVYTQQWQLKSFSEGQDEFDHASDTLIARMGSRVVAGARLCVSSPQARRRLPLESADFSLSKALLELPILDATYGECSRLAVLPEFRFGNLSRELTRQIALRSASRGLDYIFWIAPLAATRNYRKINRSLSIPTRILSHVVVPARESYESHKMHLSVAYIRGYWPDRGTIAPEQSLSA